MKFIFRKDVSLVADKQKNDISLQWHNNHEPQIVRLTKITPGILSALQAILGQGATMKDLAGIVIGLEGVPSLYKLHGYLRFLERASLLYRTVPNGDGSLVTLIPTSPYYNFHKAAIAPGQHYVLSRFAYWHRQEDQIVLESPLGHAKLVWHNHEYMPFISKLACPQNYESLLASMPTISPKNLETVFFFLLNAGLVSEVDEKGQIQEETNLALRQWEFHDLLFHTRSRLGRTLQNYGGTYRFWGEITPAPVVKTQPSKKTIPLAKPDMERLKEQDLPLAHVMEERISVRNYGKSPLTSQELGEFLYRVARVKEVIEYQDTKNNHTETIALSKRPYPSGGAQYELEFYLTINGCQNIPPGFYHYCPLNHRLCLVKEWDEQVETFWQRGTTIPGNEPPQILVTLATRLSRVSWKYEKTAYALTLKNCGVLFQNMYLVATAMGLAPCALGGGDSDFFTQIAGTDYYAETSVGEFALGSKPTEATK